MRTEYVNLAVYGTLRKGRGNHYLLQRGDVKFLGFGILRGWAYCKYLLTIKELPRHNNAFVVVEVYEIPHELLIGPIDSLEGFPTLYDRKEVTVEVMSRDHEEFIRKVVSGDSGTKIKANVYYVPGTESEMYSHSYFHSEAKVFKEAFGEIVEVKDA